MAERRILGVLPLRGTVLFPGPGVTLSVGRPGSLKTIEAAAKADRFVFAVTQRDETEEARVDNLYTMGVIAKMGQIQPGVGAVQVAVTGEQRGTAVDYRMAAGGLLTAVVLPVGEVPPLDPSEAAFRALYREVRDQARELGVLRGLPEEVLQRVIESVTEPGPFVDVVATFLELPVPEKQALLESVSVEVRLRRVLVHMQRQIQLLQTQEQIKNQVAEEIGGRQRELYLREQLKAIQKELGDGGDDPGLAELRQKLATLVLPSEARAEVDHELARFERSGRESMEGQVIRTYLQWIAELPWNTRSDDNLDLARAAQVLDEDHYGLKDVKDRVLEFLSVRLLKARNAAAAGAKKAAAPNGHGGNGQPGPADVLETKARAVARGPILLFVGPPGVGKTSIAQSVARALGRKYVRVSLGGARDEADIRGHRRTYVGALPGRIIAGMKQAGTQNPVFLLDEVDKLGVSFQGDPAAALLEVLDPAQNNTFTDHYLGVPFDLSEVLFIATGNYLHNVPGPLLDRTELVEFAGYTEREKAQIARRYLIPRQLAETGLVVEGAAEPGYAFTDDAIETLVSNYTRESGVRQLERQVGAVARKLARKIAIGAPAEHQVTAELVRELLGRPRVRPEHAGEADEIGVATGLYYSPAGGDIMFVEAAVRRLYARASRRDGDAEMLGDVSVILTGQLGEVMKESARAAVTYATTRASALHIPRQWLGAIEVHVHVPAGAIPKDGPSAGVAIVTAVVSAMSGRPVRKDVAMTGEITLRGHVLPIGGLKEKVLGAHRAGIRKVILPKANEPDLEDVPPEVREALEFHPVTHLDEIFEIALLEYPSPRESELSEPDAAPLG